VRSVATDFQRDASTRISAAETRAIRAKSKAVDLLAKWNEAEEAIEAAEAETAALRSQLEASRGREERLHGRIEQLQITRNHGDEAPTVSNASAPPAPLIGDVRPETQAQANVSPTSAATAHTPAPAATNVAGQLLAKLDEEGSSR